MRYDAPMMLGHPEPVKPHILKNAFETRFRSKIFVVFLIISMEYDTFCINNKEKQ